MQAKSEKEKSCCLVLRGNNPLFEKTEHKQASVQTNEKRNTSKEYASSKLKHFSYNPLFSKKYPLKSKQRISYLTEVDPVEEEVEEDIDISLEGDEILRQAVEILVNEMSVDWGMEVTVFQDIVKDPNTKFIVKTPDMGILEEKMFEGAYYLLGLTEEIQLQYRFYFPSKIANDLNTNKFYKEDRLSEAASVATFLLVDASFSTKCETYKSVVSFENKQVQRIITNVFVLAADIFRASEEEKASLIWTFNLQRNLARATPEGRECVDYLFDFGEPLEGGRFLTGAEFAGQSF